MSSDYTPDMDDMRIAWGYEAHTSGATNTEAVAEFDRFIAKVKSDALREAALNWGMWVKANPHLSPSPGPWCLMEADRIEGEA